MGSKRVLGVLFVILMGFLSTSQAYKFFVGGKDGWVLDPSENYSHWAERNSKNCQKGQKLIVVVLAVRNKTHHSPPPSPSPVPESPASPSPSPSPTLAESPKGVSLGSPSPEPDESRSDFDSPAPAPAPVGKTGAAGRTAGSIGLALGVSIGVSVLLSSIVGMV
ncbi:hypothetical protein FH972_014635 [Carpinus fangiana]|uniref:Phytocyanin domain-containing protein n=1 Tax=Carpinus fangiana TaxID=176857 RepID=A0A5N6RC69_9ROSI|nr:hypothetical protein FH972_014635 [Carpinus fangiana]